MLRYFKPLSGIIKPIKNGIKTGRRHMDPLDGEEVYALVQSYSTKSPKDKKFESHRKYLDIQYVVEGTEIIQYAPTGVLSIDTEYIDKDDCMLYKEPALGKRNPPQVQGRVEHPCSTETEPTDDQG